MPSNSHFEIEKVGYPAIPNLEKSVIFRKKKMSKKERKKLEKLKIDSLHEYLADKFKGFTDHRDGNKSIPLSSALMSGYAMYSLKDPSLLSFNNDRAGRKKNLKTVYKVEKAPSDSGMRTILDEVEWKEFGGVFTGILGQVKSAGVLKSYEYYQGYKIGSLDGVHYYSSEKICCKQCIEIKKQNGKTEYRHSMLSAVLVHPDKKEVLPLLSEPIMKQDGEKKNDCGRNASKRLLPKLARALAGEKIIIVEDALGSNGPHIKLILSLGFSYVIGVKPDGNKYLFDLVAGINTCLT